MPTKYKRPVPDFSAAKGPKNRIGLSITSDQLLAILKKKPGRLYTAGEILMALGEDISIWDNHAAVITAATKLLEHGKLEAGELELNHRQFSGWMAPKPKEPIDPLDEAPHPPAS